MSDNVARQKQFKNTGKHEEMRRRRAEGSLELRKQRKEEQLMKRRNIDVTSDTDDDQGAVGTAVGRSELQGDAKPLLPLSECMNIFKSGATGEPYLQVFESIRRHLSRHKTPPIDEVISLGMVPYLIHALEDPSPKVKFEVAWALTNITSGSSNQTLAVVDEGAIGALVAHLTSSDNQVAEQCAWALGNIIGESVQLRDLVVGAGIIDPLLNLLKRQNLSTECLSTVAWAISNLFRYKNPPISNESVQKLIPMLSLLIHHPEKSVVCDICWAVAYISDGAEDRIDAVLKMGILDRLAQLARHTDQSLVAPSLRALGNIVTGDDKQTQAVIDLGILGTVLPGVLSCGKSSLVREGCWLISNICAGNAAQIKEVVDSGLIPHVIQLLEKGDYRTQVESLWVIYNICSGGGTEQACFLLQQGALSAACNLLKAHDSRTLLLALDTLRLLLEVSATIGQVDNATLLVEECGGLDKLEHLQGHENEEIYRKAIQLIAKYFSEEVGTDDAAGDGAVHFQEPGSDEQFNF